LKEFFLAALLAFAAALPGCSCESDGWARSGIAGRRSGGAAAGSQWNIEVAADSPTAWWRADDGALTTGSTVPDSSAGGTHPGTLVGGWGAITPGQITGDAHGANTDNGAGIGYAGFTEITLAGDFTLECAIQVPTLPGGGGYQIACFGDGGAPMALYLDNNHVTFHDGVTNVVQDAATIVVDTRYIVHLTRSGTSVTLYVDGSAVSTGTSSATIKMKYLGWGGAGGTIASKIEQLAIYTTALSGARVSAHYAAR
jgi:hypothetical protein